MSSFFYSKRNTSRNIQTLKKENIMFKLVFISLLLFLELQAQSISWYGSYDKALQAAHKQQKNMMILLVSSKQKESMSIIKKLFMKKDYIPYVNKKYINVLINADYKTSYPIELFYTTKFPSLFFASYKDESFLSNPIYDLRDENDLREILQSLDESFK